MAVKGKGKQIAANTPEPSSSGKRKATISAAAARRKKRRPGVLQFFDEAAVDAGDDDADSNEEEAEDELEFAADFVVDTEMGTEDVKVAGKADALPFLVKEEQLSGDELEELIKDRYGPGSEHVVYAKDDKECDDRISEIHDMIETNIWRIKCMAGREKQIVFSIMQKFVDLQYFGSKLQIISAFTLDHVKGYVYIEAGKASDVTEVVGWKPSFPVINEGVLNEDAVSGGVGTSEACKGLLNLYLSRMGLVPKTEVPQLLTIRNKVFEVAENAWVRLRSGKYKGDLAQIVAVDENQKSVTVKLIPRVDLQAMSRKFGGGVSLKASANPAPRLLSSQELEDFRPHIQVRRDRQTGEVFDVLDGLMLKDGFLYKKVSIGSLICWGVQPTKAELLKFSDISKDKVEDLDWISSIYSGRKKKSDIEASDRKTEANHQGNGYELYDLVLFGRKDFGVIISMENHNYEILKCDMGRPEVVTVKQQEIKSCCVDKMFTALDREKRTIFIDDIVKVLEGPLEDKQGVVRHMYRGMLFIHDDDQVENSGFSCVKSDLCEKIQESRKSYGGKKGGKSSTYFTQSPKRSDQDEDFTSTFNRSRERERKETYSIGQTLRIRKGPLKGYLCRVVGVYRSDVTVKLDSLVKVITVEENMLSIPNLKRDEPAATSFNSFGAQDSHGLEQGADLWDSKGLFGSASGTCDSTRVIDSWAKSTGPSLDADTAWMKRTVGENVAANANAEADAWDTKAKGLDIGNDKANAWDTKAKGLDIGNDKADAWDTKANGLDGNDKAAAWSTKAEGVVKNVDAWDKGVHSRGRNNEDNKGWGRSSKISNEHATSKVGDQTESWDKAAAIRSQSSGGLGASSWDRSKALIIDSQPENFRSAGGQNELEHSGHQVTSWEPKFPCGGQSANWEKPKATSIIEKGVWKKEGTPSEGDMDGWSGSKAIGGDQLSNWDRSIASSSGKSENCGNPKNAIEGESSRWKKAVAASSQGQPGGWRKPKCSFGNQISGWNNEHDKEPSNWDQPKGFGGCGPSSWNAGADQADGWHRKKQSDILGNSGGWNKNVAPSSMEAGGRSRLQQANASGSKCSWGAPPASSEAVDQGGGWEKQGSTVGQKRSSAFTGGERGGGEGSCDQPKGLGGDGTSSWNAESAKAEGWNRKKGFDSSSGAGGWNKSFVSPSKQGSAGSGPPQANASGDNGNWETKTSGWGDAKDDSGGKSRW